MNGFWILLIVIVIVTALYWLFEAMDDRSDIKDMRYLSACDADPRNYDIGDVPVDVYFENNEFWWIDGRPMGVRFFLRWQYWHRNFPTKDEL